MLTREVIKDFQSIVQAWIEGKTIQYNFDEGWRDANIEHLLGDISKYRIKPEPKYRPFNNQEECWEEMHKHSDFGFIREKGTKVIYSIAMIDNFYLSTQDKSEHLCDTMDVYEFLDGMPFGIKEE